MSKIIFTDRKVIPPLTREPHVIPRFYLNKFADNYKRVWVYRQEQSPKLRSTKALTTELDYFEYTIDGVQTANAYEKWLSRVESKAARVYPKLLCRQKLSPEESCDWATFAASLFLRTKKLREQACKPIIASLVHEQTSAKKILEMQYKLFQQGYLLDQNSLREKIQAQWSEVADQPAYFQLSDFPSRTTRLASFLHSRDWDVVDAAPQTQFVTSDSPISTCKIDESGTVYPGANFGNSDVIVYLPLAPNKLWIAGPKSIRCMPVLDRATVGVVNKLSVRFGGEMVFARSEDKDLELLVKAELNQFVFGFNTSTTLQQQHHP